MKKKLKELSRRNPFLENVIYGGYQLFCYFQALCFMLCRIFPINQNKIVCCNMKGSRYGDNPKYITDELLRQNTKHEIIWLVKNVDTHEVPKEVKMVKYGFWNNIYELSTAKIWIDSNLKDVGVKKRKGQIYIQTWHGSYGFKRIGLDAKEKNRIEIGPCIYNATIYDLMISNSWITTQIYRSAFRYEGNVLECGSPRNDIFFQSVDVYKNKVRMYFNTGNKRLVLFAPTYRNNMKTEQNHMDFDRLLRVLSIRFGGEWCVLIRMHPANIVDAESFIEYSNNIINATRYDVMQELLAAVDIVISDYSSSMLDFVTIPRPCFIYAADINNYKKERDFYYDIKTLPFPIAENNDEMEKNILEFNEKEYYDNVAKMHERVGLRDKGDACRQVVEYIKEIG